MISPLVKIINVDGFYGKEHADFISNATYDLQYVDKEFGKEIENFNMLPPDANKMFSDILGSNIEVSEESGFFRKPQGFIHFEPFESLNEWIFVTALQDSIFNVYEHQSGAKNALDNYKHNYRNLFEWDHKINFQLSPGDGVLFRPWLFHSFDTGQIQIFKLKEHDTIL